MKPRRIQLRRTRGWCMPANTVKVDRSTVYGNPFVAPAIPSGATIAVGQFKIYAVHKLAEEPDWLAPLVGKNLACWCKRGAPCHADVLLYLANRRARK